MTLAVSASAVGSMSPQIVQVVATGLTDGVAFTITGSISSGFTWTVAGANGQLASGTSAILGDVAAPTGTAITYTVEQSGTTAGSSTVTVTMPADADVAIQSIDGQQVALAFRADNRDPRTSAVRQALFPVPGRRSPVVRWDVATSPTATLAIETSGTATSTLLTMLGTGAPFILRTDGEVRDLDPVEFMLPTGSSNQLVGSVGDVRRWEIPYQVIDNPLPSVAVAPSTWDDFDSAWSALDWDGLDSAWSSSTWDDFDATDWANY